jgi:hypothetical protein
MKWIDGLKVFNKTKKNWVVHRKGTTAYTIVMKMIKPEIVNTNKFKPMMMKALRSQA